jgi:hypothetical protein
MKRYLTWIAQMSTTVELVDAETGLEARTSRAGAT